MGSDRTGEVTGGTVRLRDMTPDIGEMRMRDMTTDREEVRRRDMTTGTVETKRRDMTLEIGDITGDTMKRRDMTPEKGEITGDTMKRRDMKGEITGGTMKRRDRGEVKKGMVTGETEILTEALSITNSQGQRRIQRTSTLATTLLQ